MLHILTLHWNKLDSLIRLKDSLIPSLQKIDYKWHIKDNNSSDGSYEAALCWDNKNTIYHQYPNNNQTFSQGCNYLFDLANPNDDDLVLFLNNDVHFTDTQSIQRMINIIERDKNVGVVGAKLLYTGTNKVQHCGVVFTENRKLPGSPALPIHLHRGAEATEHTNKDREFQAITAAVMLLKASDFRAAGKFDEQLKWCFDDTDICNTINKVLKKKIIMCGSTNIQHDESASLKLNPVNKLYLQHNITYFTGKWRNRVETDVYKYLTNPDHNLYGAK